MSESNGNDVADGNKRFEDELAEQRPAIFVMLNAFLTVCFFIYDAFMYIPFKVIADPEKKRELSERVKVFFMSSSWLHKILWHLTIVFQAHPVVEEDPSSGWRHVESMDKLLSNAYEACDTLGDIWDRTASEHEDSACMGTRQVCNKYMMGRTS